MSQNGCSMIHQSITDNFQTTLFGELEHRHIKQRELGIKTVSKMRKTFPTLKIVYFFASTPTISLTQSAILFYCQKKYYCLSLLLVKIWKVLKTKPYSLTQSICFAKFGLIQFGSFGYFFNLLKYVTFGFTILVQVEIRVLYFIRQISSSYFAFGIVISTLIGMVCLWLNT